jgi:hypothetical protein
MPFMASRYNRVYYAFMSVNASRGSHTPRFPALVFAMLLALAVGEGLLYSVDCVPVLNDYYVETGTCLPQTEKKHGISV